MRRSLSSLSALVRAAALGAQQPSSYSYDFRAKGDHETDGITGTVRVSGGPRAHRRRRTATVTVSICWSRGTGRW